MRVQLLPFLFAALVLGSGCSSQNGLSAELQTAPPDTSILAQRIPVMMSAAEIPAMSVAVLNDGKIYWSRGFGITDPRSNSEVHSETVFPAASLSKPVFAYIVLRLRDRDQIDLDKPLFEYLPYDRLSHDDRYKSITARRVLSHTSGLPNWGGSPLTMIAAPGERFRYSGEGFVYLQAVVEHITGESLQELAQREVFDLLEMSHSSFVWRDEYASNPVVGKSRTNRPAEIRRTENGNAAWSLLTTANDYARFLSALQNGEGLETATAAEVRSTQSNVSSEEYADALGWGLGIGLETTDSGTAFWHWGDNGAFRAFVIGYPEQRTGLVYFASSADGLSILSDLVESVFPGNHPAVEWLDYDDYRTDRFIALKKLQRSFTGDSLQAALAELDRYRRDQPDVVDESLVNTLGYYLLGRDEHPQAAAVFGRNVQWYPESANVYDSRGEAAMMAWDYDTALENYRKALELDPENDNAARRIAWIEEEISLRPELLPLTQKDLIRYSGTYGEWAVWLYGPIIVLSGPDLDVRRPMIPIREDLFVLRGKTDVRVQFFVDDDKRVEKIELQWMSGRRMELPRTQTMPTSG